MTIKNIIFDLGGVIIDIDFQLTTTAFNQLGAGNFDAIFNKNAQINLFDHYETGKFDSSTFREKLCQQLNIAPTQNEFDQAWSAMLLDLPKERLMLIKNLREKYKTFLFSNTNEIHLNEVFAICQRQNGFGQFSDFFDKEYYSNVLGMRKPHPDAFIAILNENEIKAEETLFVDDSQQNIEGAREAGLFVMHLTPEKSIFDVSGFLEEINRKR